MKTCIITSTEHHADLQQPFRSNPGEGPAAKDLTIDQIYVNGVIHEGRLHYDFPTDRWEQLKVYPTPNAQECKPLKPQDIIDCRQKKVLAVGRPGIGKTLFCTMLLRTWAFDETTMQSQFKVAFLVKFRYLNTKPDLNLRDLLACSETIEHLDDEVWRYVEVNPAKVLLIFDGLDEFSAREYIAKDDSCYKNTGEERMPVHCLYKKIVCGKLLQDVTVITTIRPTAVECVRQLTFDRTIEFIGFTSEQVEEYVEKFTKDDDSADLKETIWQHIRTNINLFSLCYIPVNCFIICHCLLELIKISKDAAHELPVKMTEIYSTSVKMFFYKHNRDDDGKYSRSKTELGSYIYKRFDELQPENELVFKKLGDLAFNGIKHGRIVFESSEVKPLEDCGLLHRLPDVKHRKLSEAPEAQYCFTHLTVQEFFAAKHVTDTMNKEELQTFVADHINAGAWQVVMQFVAGLLQPNAGQEMPNGEIFSQLLPTKVEKIEGRDTLSWWPCGEKEQRLTVNICKCLYEMDAKQQVAVQNRVVQIGLNAVNFSELELVPVDCTAIMHFVRNAHGILKLNMDFNYIGSLGCKAIHLALKDVKCKLTELNLESNEIGDQGAAHLSDALKDVNCKLTIA